MSLKYLESFCQELYGSCCDDEDCNGCDEWLNDNTCYEWCKYNDYNVPIIISERIEFQAKFVWIVKIEVNGYESYGIDFLKLKAKNEAVKKILTELIEIENYRSKHERIIESLILIDHENNSLFVDNLDEYSIKTNTIVLFASVKNNEMLEQYEDNISDTFLLVDIPSKEKNAADVGMIIWLTNHLNKTKHKYNNIILVSNDKFILPIEDILNSDKMIKNVPPVKIIKEPYRI